MSEELGYEPLSRLASLRAGYRILDRLAGVEITCVQAKSGSCDDCQRSAERFQYGQFTLCRPCVSARRGIQLTGDDETS